MEIKNEAKKQLVRQKSNMNTSSLTAGVLNNVVQSNPLHFYKTLQWKCHIIALALKGDSQQDLVSMGPY